MSSSGASPEQPLVRLKIGAHEHWMMPNEARTLASLLYRCADAADMDVYVVRSFGERDLDTP